MVLKRLSLILGLILGINLPMFAIASNEDRKNPFIEKYESLQKFNAKFGLPRSTPREVAEQLVVVVLHGGTEIKDGTITFDVKKGITTARDLLQKKATYGFLSKAIFEGLLKAKKIEDQEGKKQFEAVYDDQIKPFIGDGLDFVFRGIKYMNDDAKEQAILAYIKNDFLPYIVKKKIVWLAEKGLQYAVRKALEQNQYGQLVVAGYDIMRMIPVIGMELELLPTSMLEYLYDKGVAVGRDMMQKYAMPIVPEIKSRIAARMQAA